MPTPVGGPLGAEQQGDCEVDWHRAFRDRFLASRRLGQKRGLGGVGQVKNQDGEGGGEQLRVDPWPLVCTRVVDDDGDERLHCALLAALDGALGRRVALLVVQIDFVVASLGVLHLDGPADLIPVMLQISYYYSQPAKGLSKIISHLFKAPDIFTSLNLHHKTFKLPEWKAGSFYTQVFWHYNLWKDPKLLGFQSFRF